jgi:hypothetical protein
MVVSVVGTFFSIWFSSLENKQCVIQSEELQLPVQLMQAQFDGNHLEVWKEIPTHIFRYPFQKHRLVIRMTGTPVRASKAEEQL